ncbi:MAG: HipA N-terminal domain-containing protein, partial [Spirochaetales bacterium]|nr:HipA N-terminal domain-containing protein [Spirochaetales bacterium]
MYYKGVHIGKLETTKERGIVFSYTELAQAPISISLRDISRTYAEKECLPFFEGLLPEGEIRRQIAFFAHVSASSTMKLLEEFGA